MKKVNVAIWVAIIGAIGTIIAAYISIQKPKKSPSIQVPESIRLLAPFNGSNYFFPSGWMGDGEEGTRYVQLDMNFFGKPRKNDTDNSCIKVSYQPGPREWAGIYWQFPENNWGKQPGKRIEGATRLIFWACGDKGGEKVEFKAGGIASPGMRYMDTFEISMKKIILDKEWLRYEILLKGQDLSNVIGAFAWIATKGLNPNGLIFYLDDIRYE